MENLFVPIIVNDTVNVTRNSLFCVECKIINNSDISYFNGWNHTNSENIAKKEFLRNLNDKLKSYFISDTFDFQIWETGKNLEHGTFEKFSESTASISLGVFCSAYSKIYKRHFKEKYNSITVTGDFSVQDRKIFLSDVTDIEEKYKAVQDYASKNADKKHLFVYISSKEIIPDGIQENNVHVIRYDSTFPAECVFAEVFEPSDIQKQCIQSLQQYKKEYIETAPFIKWKRELAQSNCNGILLHGASDSGKTIAATTLCKYMITTVIVEEIIWITISDNRVFWDKLHRSFSTNFSEIIKEEFSVQFDTLDKLLDENKKCCLIFDNIQGDFTDSILSFTKDNYKSALDKKVLKIIITAWKNLEDRSVLQDLQLQEKNCESLIAHRDLKYIVYSAFENMGMETLSFKGFKKNQNKLLELLSELCFDEKKSYPGRINNSIASILEIGIDSFIKRYSQEDLKKLTKKTRQFRIDFEILDLISQWVLFAILGINNFEEELDIKKIYEIISTKIFNEISENSFISEQNIVDSVNKLIKKDWIHESKPNSNIFYIKTDTIYYCVFSDYEKNEISKNLVLARDVLIPVNAKIDYAIQNDLYDKFEYIINRHANINRNIDFYSQCVKYNRSLVYLELLKKKGFEIQTKENEPSPLDHFWLYNTNLDVLKFLIDAGYKVRKKFYIQGAQNKKIKYAASPLFLSFLNYRVTKKNNFEIIKYILKEHICEDINEIEFEGLSAIQTCALFCSNPKILQILLKNKADKNITTSIGETLLHLATRNEDSSILEYILKEHIYNDIEEKNNAGWSALQWACLCGTNAKTIHLLLDSNANRNVISSNGETLLHLATRNKNSSILEYILKEHIYNDIEEKNNAGWSALQWACLNGKNAKTIHLLLDSNANRNVISSKGRTLLHLASKNENSCILEYLLKEHIYNDIDEKDNAGLSPLQWACLCGTNAKTIHLLLDSKANRNVISSKGRTLLHLASKNENSCILEYLLKEHIYNDIDEKDNAGWTSLHIACRHNKNGESIRSLVEYRADKSVVTSDGWAALPLAAQNKNSAILEYILKNHYYSNIDECGENGNTALFQARTLESFKLLLEHRADPKIITSKGNNILHAAVLFNRKEIVEHILKHLPMVSRIQKNLDGKTPADLAESDDIKKLFEKL